ncbi:MAG: hypothetical protein GX493_01295 [Firmicutes bacterium]|nr:hypothetical protein [Bacillota bacterium]
MITYNKGRYIRGMRRSDGTDSPSRSRFLWQRRAFFRFPSIPGKNLGKDANPRYDNIYSLYHHIHGQPAPGALRRGFAYVFDGAYNGRFEQYFFRSKEMRDIWWNKANEGHTFNAEVAKALSEVGWQVRENIGLPEILNRKFEQNYGDIDVLAWRNDRQEVLVIECKDLSLARNYSEIAALLSDYQGAEIEGKPDRLRRHLNRVKLLRENCDQIQRFTGEQEPRIVSCLGFSGAVPMQYARIDALTDTHVGEISDIIKLYLKSPELS